VLAARPTIRAIDRGKLFGWERGPAPLVRLEEVDELCLCRQLAHFTSRVVRGGATAHAVLGEHLAVLRERVERVVDLAR
jgi:hypothetical protein